MTQENKIAQTADHPIAAAHENGKAAISRPAVQLQSNNTGLPDDLKSGIEGLSGISMEDVRVHYNSSKPAQLQAYAYAQGADIHIAPGQERHLPHEAWHVVQQKQGRVNATTQLKINDDAGLEEEADVMGSKALQLKAIGQLLNTVTLSTDNPVQLKANYDATNNRVLSRPDETKAIEVAKDVARATAKVRLDQKAEAKRSVKAAKLAAKRIARKENKGKTNKVIEQAARTKGKEAQDTRRESDEVQDILSLPTPALEFTAHHKYPWHSIKRDIEAAFVAPSTDESNAKLSELEAFSTIHLPVNPVNFLTDQASRVNEYQQHQPEIDGWIQEVCWVPANIFIGPLSSDRIDDPSRKPAQDDGTPLDKDAHYNRRTRRMSIRSERLNNEGPGGLYNGNDANIQNTVGPYNINEWTRHGVKSGEPGFTFSQTGDDYFEDNLFLYNSKVTEETNTKYDKRSYVFNVETGKNITTLSATYKKTLLLDDTSELMDADCQELSEQPDKKVWSVTLLTPQRFLINDVQLTLTNQNNATKIVPLNINLSFESAKGRKDRIERKKLAAANVKVDYDGVGGMFGDDDD